MKLNHEQAGKLLIRWRAIMPDYNKIMSRIYPVTNSDKLAVITSAMLEELAEKAYRAGWYLGIHGPMKAMGDNSEWNIRFQYNGAKKGLVVNVKAPTKDEAVLMACEAVQ